MGYLAVLGGGMLIAAFAGRRITEPYLAMTLGLLLLLLTGWFIHPRATLYATLLLTAVADQMTVWWFPFVKNLSSRESITFIADAATLSPLDLALLSGAAISVLRHYADTGRPLARSQLTGPLIVLTGFVLFGFLRGLVAYGDARIAVFEGRPLFYIVLAFVIVTNECTEQAHLRRALWAILAGVVIQALLSIQYVQRLDPADRDAMTTLNEHGSTIGHHLVIVTLVALLLFKVRRPATVAMLAVAAVPVVYVLFLAQRRSGIAALVVGGALMAVVLFWRRPRTFWLVVPVLALAIATYTAAFWSSGSDVAFPAQAIKSVIAPGSAKEEDAGSDLYRYLEGLNLNITIKAEPLLGLGFGRAFYRPVPLPDISWYEFYAYKPHNSVLWFWIKTGFFGFVTMFYVFGRTILLGAHRLRSVEIDVDFVVRLVSTLFVVMFAVFSWVDISWDARNCVFLGFAIAACTRAPRDRDDGAPGPVLSEPEVASAQLV
jgi:O-antigen ligase